MKKLSDGSYFNTTVGLLAEHDLYNKPMLIRIQFTSSEENGDVTLKAVNGHSLGLIKKTGFKTITREAYEDRPRDNIEEARWAMAFLGWEV